MIKSDYTSVFTIGHSDHPMGRFIELLVSHGITAVADVRSIPYSRFNPQFNREPVQTALNAAAIRYVFLGDVLGARRSEIECYVKGKARYELIARTPGFKEGLQRLREGMEHHRIALMCAEKDPLTCHRAILICRHLRSADTSISHILNDGHAESNDELEARLLKLTKVDPGGLFGDRADAIERAYDIQGNKIAYTESTAEQSQENVEFEHQDIHNRIH